MGKFSLLLIRTALRTRHTCNFVLLKVVFRNRRGNGPLRSVGAHSQLNLTR